MSYIIVMLFSLGAGYGFGWASAKAHSADHERFNDETD
jgi:hypothetical protein